MSTTTSCCPTGSLEPLDEAATAVCDCGATVTAVPSGPDDWKWVDSDGNQIIDTSPAGYRENPKAWWATLAKDDIAAYSALSARFNLGMLGWTHMHRPAHAAPARRRPPQCCSEPMRWTPSGWRCRR